MARLFYFGKTQQKRDTALPKMKLQNLRSPHKEIVTERLSAALYKCKISDHDAVQEFWKKDSRNIKIPFNELGFQNIS